MHFTSPVCSRLLQAPVHSQMQYILVLALLAYAYATILGARAEADAVALSIPSMCLSVLMWTARLIIFSLVNTSGLAMRLASAKTQYERANALAVFMERMTDAVLSRR